MNLPGLLFSLFLIGIPVLTTGQVYSWWPKQTVPKKIAICTRPERTAEMNLAQSLSGLAAQAVNQNTLDEGIWIETPNPGYDTYFKTLLQRTGIKKGRSYRIWSLARSLHRKGAVRGYILYDLDSEQPSVNIATVQAGLLQGALVDVSLREKAESIGLRMLFDATAPGLTDSLNFENAKASLNNNLLVLIDPENGLNRDYAIAHRAMVYYGVDSMLYKITSWVKPLSPVVGWNSGAEFLHIAPCTYAGLINTVSDWCMNLPMLTIEDRHPGKKFGGFDPYSIDWNEDLNYHAFVMSDGDNMQWLFGSFIHNPEYWANPYAAELSMNFTVCAANLSMAGGDPLRELIRTQPQGVTAVEYGGGYYYPDLFAKDNPERASLLRELAATVNIHMQKTGLKVLSFICRDIRSKNAMEAYRIFAEEVEGLTGILVVQYAPYNDGDGTVVWVKDRDGIEIPVLPAKNMIWANLPVERSGGPGMIACEINKMASTSSPGDRRKDWTVVHSWSRFGMAPDGTITDGDQNDKSLLRGVTPLRWCKELITPQTRLVSVEEVLWRLRMDRNPQQTRVIIDRTRH